jgi:DNA-binding HxlR family transcriptional regulator
MTGIKPNGLMLYGIVVKKVKRVKEVRLYYSLTLLTILTLFNYSH